MQINDHTEHHQLADGQLVTDVTGQLWRVSKHQFGTPPGPVETWLSHWSDEYAVWLSDEKVTGPGHDDNPLFPLTVVKVVPAGEPGAWHVPPGEAAQRLVAKYGVAWTDELAAKGARWDDEDIALVCNYYSDQSGAHVWRQFCQQVLVRLREAGPASGQPCVFCHDPGNHQPEACTCIDPCGAGWCWWGENRARSRDSAAQLP